MPGLYSNGFSLSDWNKTSHRRQVANQRRQEAEDKANAASTTAANDCFQKLVGGIKLLTLPCTDVQVIRKLKDLVRKDGRFNWNYDQQNRIHFAPKQTAS